MIAEKLNAAIETAVKQLKRSERGQTVANQLHDLFTGPASGLDSSNQEAVALLTLAFCKGGRRDFVHNLKTESERYPS